MAMRVRAQVLAVAGVVAVTVVATPWLAASGSTGSTGSAESADGVGSAPHAAQSEGGGGHDDELLARGEELFLQGCSSCHGADGRGVEIRDGAAGGPSLEEAGEAGAYYYLSTGRMPLNNSEEQPEAKEPAYPADDIDALVAYVASLGDGPELPEVDLAGADLAQGGIIYRANCQACHSASGSGGALSYGRAAPRLGSVEPQQIAAAVRTGPGQMPVFGADTLTGEELNDLVRYVRYLQHPDDPGGLPIGRTGPIPEGFVAWLIGMVSLLALTMWIGTRSPISPARRRAAEEGTTEA
jgi:ubiquinol-cytochrome c reductase cytochrome c subunit